MKQEELQQKYIQLQLLDKQIRELQQQIQLFDSQAAEIQSIIASIGEFKDVSKGTEILVPISSGIFARAKLEENKDLLMNVGSNVVVNKNFDDAKKLLSDQLDKVKKLQDEWTDELTKLANKALPLQEEINKSLQESE